MGKLKSFLGTVFLCGAAFLGGMYVATHESCKTKVTEKTKEFIDKLSTEQKVTDDYHNSNIAENVTKIMNENPAYKTSQIRLEYNQKAAKIMNLKY